jgi:hypothetical protein
MADDDRAPDRTDAENELLLQIQVDAMNHLGTVARKRIAWDVEAGGSTDLFTKALIMRAELSALLQLCLAAGVFTYEDYVHTFAAEAADIAVGYERDELTADALERAQRIKLAH